MIGVGVGFSTSAFSIVYGLVERGLPGPAGDRLVLLGGRFSDPEFETLQRGQVAFDGFSAYGYLAGTDRASVNLSDDDALPERVPAAFVRYSALDVLGVPPALGRVFRAGEDSAGTPRTVVLGDQLWRERFGGSPDVVGHPVRINGEVATVIGVMPAGFRFPFDSKLWVSDRRETSDARSLLVFGTLKPGVSIDAATDQLTVLASSFARKARDGSDVRIGARPFHRAYLPSQMIGGLSGLASVGVLCLLLLTCSNIGNVLTAQGTDRAQEIAVRKALGAPRGRIVRQLFAESSAVGILGCLAGLVVAHFLILAFANYVAGIGAGPYWLRFALDWPAVLFALGCTFGTALVTGTIPALWASRARLSGRGGSPRLASAVPTVTKLRSALVSTQVAFACALLVCTSLILSPILRFTTEDLGFRVESVVTGTVRLPHEVYPSGTDRERVFREFAARLEVQPGIADVALTSSLPGIGRSNWSVLTRRDENADYEPAGGSNGSAVTHQFFQVFDILILRGRGFDESDDRAGSEPVAVVSEVFARKHWGADDDALGRFVRLEQEGSRTDLRVVGVVRDVHEGVDVTGAANPIQGHLYVPFHSRDPDVVAVAIRHVAGSSSAVDAARETLSSIDSDVPLYSVATLRGALAQTMFVHVLFGRVFTSLGAVALILSATGLHSLLAFEVARRRRELGIIAAMGANRVRVLFFVLRSVVFQLGVGLLLGLGLGVAIGRFLGTSLYGVNAIEPLATSLAIGTLATAGAIATLGPALRATRTSPAGLLRTE